MVATVITSVAFAAALAWLSMHDRLLNPAFVNEVGLSANHLQTLDVAIAVSAVLVATYEIGEALVKGVLHRAK